MNTKTCITCRLLKSYEDFSVKTCAPDGLQPSCKSCVSEYDKIAYQRARQKRLAQVATRYVEKREEIITYTRGWRASHPSYDRDNYACNPERCITKTKRRDAAIRERTVPWHDANIIRFFVTTRAWICTETGTKWEIDHVIPLQGKRVSGLHVHTNLRIVPALVNMQKQNQFVVA